MNTARPAESVLRAPPGYGEPPSYEDGWRGSGGDRAPFLSFVEPMHAVNWSEELEDLHEESSRTHFIDVWTRRAMLDRVGPLPAGPIVADLGCSTGYLLEDVRASLSDATMIGADLVGSGLRKAHENVPDARLIQADLCDLPIEDGSIDAVLSANVLEHVPDDVGAIREICRVLRPGARAVLVVPAGPRLYDYYDRFLDHERRYAAGELREKVTRSGLEVVEEAYLGSLIFPAFWFVKKRNRRRYGKLRGAALEARVAEDIDATRDSGLGRVACRLERRLLDRGVRIPFGIRNLLVARRPLASR